MLIDFVPFVDFRHSFHLFGGIPSNGETNSWKGRTLSLPVVLCSKVSTLVTNEQVSLKRSILSE